MVDKMTEMDESGDEKTVTPSEKQENFKNDLELLMKKYDIEEYVFFGEVEKGQGTLRNRCNNIFIAILIKMLAHKMQEDDIDIINTVKLLMDMRPAKDNDFRH